MNQLMEVSCYERSCRTELNAHLGCSPVVKFCRLTSLIRISLVSENNVQKYIPPMFMHGHRFCNKSLVGEKRLSYAAGVYDCQQGRSHGGYIGIYTLPKSGYVNFLWSNNDVSTYYIL